MKRDDLKNIIINCRTKGEARDVCNLADRLGWVWSNGARYTDRKRWGVYRKKTCYNFYKGVYCHMDYSGKEYVIQSAQWFLDNFALDGDIKIRAGRAYRCLNDIMVIDDRGRFDFVRGDEYKSTEDGYLLNNGEDIRVCGVNLRDFEEIGVEGVSDGAIVINEIDWERRRWELAKELYLSWGDKSAIALADEFISEYRKL